MSKTLFNVSDLFLIIDTTTYNVSCISRNSIYNQFMELKNVIITEQNVNISKFSKGKFYNFLEYFNY